MSAKQPLWLLYKSQKSSTTRKYDKCVNWLGPTFWFFLQILKKKLVVALPYIMIIPIQVAYHTWSCYYVSYKVHCILPQYIRSIHQSLQREWQSSPQTSYQSICYTGYCCCGGFSSISMGLLCCYAKFIDYLVKLHCTLSLLLSIHKMKFIIFIMKWNNLDLKLRYLYRSVWWAFYEAKNTLGTLHCANLIK